jgi:hypothetical protein
MNDLLALFTGFLLKANVRADAEVKGSLWPRENTTSQVQAVTGAKFSEDF